MNCQNWLSRVWFAIYKPSALTRKWVQTDQLGWRIMKDVQLKSKMGFQDRVPYLTNLIRVLFITAEVVWCCYEVCSSKKQGYVGHRRRDMKDVFHTFTKRFPLRSVGCRISMNDIWRMFGRRSGAMRDTREETWKMCFIYLSRNFHRKTWACGMQKSHWMIYEEHLVRNDQLLTH